MHKCHRILAAAERGEATIIHIEHNHGGLKTHVSRETLYFTLHLNATQFTDTITHFRHYLHIFFPICNLRLGIRSQIFLVHCEKKRGPISTFAHHWGYTSMITTRLHNRSNPMMQASWMSDSHTSCTMIHHASMIRNHCLPFIGVHMLVIRT